MWTASALLYNTTDAAGVDEGKTFWEDLKVFTEERPLADSTISDDAARDSTHGALKATDADKSDLGGGSTTHTDDTAADDGFRLVKFSASEHAASGEA